MPTIGYGLDSAPQQMGKCSAKKAWGRNSQRTFSQSYQARALSKTRNDEAYFIKNKIKCRECICFVEKPKQENTLNDEEKLCHCSYPKKDHIKRTNRHHKWDYSNSKQTKTKPTNAFGEIEFVGFGDRIGKYIRVDVDTPMETMLGLLTKVWRMEMPNLLISVTGGAKNFTMKSRLKEVFRRGLVKAALSTGAWIVTGGTYAGVMKHVGEAVRDFGLTSQGRVTTIGIATWGCVQNKEYLIRNKENENGPVPYRIESEVKQKQSFLDPNHSHFILVDNGTQHQFTVEIPFRAKLEEAISKQKTDTGSDAITVPVCLLVLEGGPGTLETVVSAIKSTTPTVVIKGSGKTADILAYAYQNSKEEEIKHVEAGKSVKKTITILEPQIVTKIREMINSAFGDSDLEKRVEWVKDCCTNRDLLSVFELDSKNSAKDVDLAILKALFKANKNQELDQLKLALAWNRIDVAKSEIFTDERSWPTGMLDDAMMSAIKLNRVDFVELFLDNGVSLKNFLTIKRLIMLYNNANVGHLLQDLLGDFYQPHYLTDKQFRGINVDELLDSKSSQKTNSSGPYSNNTSISAEQSKDEYVFNSPAQELFIWAVLMNYLKLSKLFWREGKQSATAACLFAHSVLKSLKAHTMDSKCIRKLEIAANNYEELAIGVLNNCYSSDEARTHDLLIQNMPHWGKTTCVQIAVKSDNQFFIAQNACQSLLTKVWMGKMSQSNNFFMILLCILLFPLVNVLIKFNEENIKQKKPTSTNGRAEVKKQTVKNGIERQSTALSIKPPTIVQSKTKSFTTSFQNIGYFYKSPVVKFVMNVITYMIFLVLYSYILVVQLKPEFHFMEGILIFWVVSILMEEIREFLISSAHSVKSKLKTYVSNRWNILDILCILLFVLGFILRFIPDEDFMTAARVVLSINLITFFIRMLHIFSVNKQLGPKLVMIGRMLEDLKWFVVILLVFVVSYALASEAVLYPNTTPNWKLLYYVPRKAYWQIYGELFLDDIEGDDNCKKNMTEYKDDDTKRCPSEVGKYFVPILLGFYMLMTNVLLLNLLIAMFSYTFQQIQDNTDMHWCFQRFKLIFEYTERPVLPPPVIIFNHVYLIISYYYHRCSPVQTGLKAFSKTFQNKEEERQLMQWEDLIADNFLDSKEKSERNSIEGKVKATIERLDQVLFKVDELQESQSQNTGQPSGAANFDSHSSCSVVDKRVEALENQGVQQSYGVCIVGCSTVIWWLYCKAFNSNLVDSGCMVGCSTVELKATDSNPMSASDFIFKI
ncbi:Transient receptor putative cation channel sub M member 2 [Bulinus truncatus]|nr:Transient receptor putative cation channel sub M member 2 [Bulinus truncatus]